MEQNLRSVSKWLDAGRSLCENERAETRLDGVSPPGREPQRGMRMQQKTVKMYTLSTCSHCRAAKKLMSALGVRYDYVDVDLLSGNERAAALEEVRKLNPLCSFPTILIGDTVIVGNREDKIREALEIT
jgi:glutaredoxin-like protein NrdH